LEPLFAREGRPRYGVPVADAAATLSVMPIMAIIGIEPTIKRAVRSWHIAVYFRGEADIERTCVVT
jgi:hypothetical protein